MYSLIQGIAFIVFITFITIRGSYFGSSRIKALILGICVMAINLMLVKTMAWVANGFQGFGAENEIRVYAVAPIAFYIIAKVAKVDVLNFFDEVALAGPLVYGIGHYACIFAGCCQGFSYFEGTAMYEVAYTLTQSSMLPLQFLESTSALLVFAVLYLIGVKKNFQTKGRLFCLWYIIFGTQRFFWEFLRDNTKLIVFAPLKQTNGNFGISNLAIWAILMVVSGIIVYFCIRRSERKAEKKTI